MKTTLLLCIFALAIGASWHANANSEKGVTSAKADSTTIDPICQMKVKLPSKIKSTYQEKQYNFCNPGCKTKFDKNPTKYVKNRK